MFKLKYLTDDMYWLYSVFFDRKTANNFLKYYKNSWLEWSLIDLEKGECIDGNRRW